MRKRHDIYLLLYSRYPLYGISTKTLFSFKAEFYRVKEASEIKTYNLLCARENILYWKWGAVVLYSNTNYSTFWAYLVYISRMVSRRSCLLLKEKITIATTILSMCEYICIYSKLFTFRHNLVLHNNIKVRAWMVE